MARPFRLHEIQLPARAQSRLLVRALQDRHDRARSLQSAPAMGQHADYKYSVTIQSDDTPLVAALRGLAWYSQRTGNKQIAWGGTKARDWEKSGHRVTFHFSSEIYRTEFLENAARLFPSGWREINQSNSDPAIPQGSQL